VASDGDKPLPDTDDPFVLLGVALDADDKAIKQAYAKLIRRFRPDRAPSEFQRIHAAFEQIRESREQNTSRFVLRASLPETPDASDAPPAPMEPAEGTVDHATIAQRLRDAWARPDEAAAIIDELLDAGTPLEVLVEGETDRFLLLRHPRFSWTRLRKLSDPRTVLAVWEMAFDDALFHDPQRAHALLDDEHLRLDAADYLRVADSTLRRIGALAWRRLAGIEALFDGYRRAIPSGFYVNQLVDSIHLEIEAARATVDLDGPIRWLTPLLVAARIGTDEDRRRHAVELLAMMSSNVDFVLVELHHLQRRAQLDSLFELFYDYLPPRYFRLDAMPPPVFERLTKRLHNIGRQPNKWAIRAGVLAGLFAVGYAVSVLVAVAIAVAGGAYLLATEERRYRTEIRPRVARAIVRCAVTPEVVARWIDINGRMAGRLWAFDLAIRNDATLYTLAMIAAFATFVGGLDEETVEVHEHD
jgi:hypothetical protein